MIVVTRLNGVQIAINGDLIERIEETPDTVITLTDGNKYVVSESIQDIINSVREFRASVSILTHKLAASDFTAVEPALHVVRDSEDTEV